MSVDDTTQNLSFLKINEERDKSGFATHLAPKLRKIYSNNSQPKIELIPQSPLITNIPNLKTKRNPYINDEDKEEMNLLTLKPPLKSLNISFQNNNEEDKFLSLNTTIQKLSNDKYSDERSSQEQQHIK